MKHYAEREASERLPDFEITIGTLHLQPLRLAIDVQDVSVRLRAYPDPPLAVIPYLKADVGFLLLLTGKFDVTVQIEHPELAATSQQVDSILERGGQAGGDRLARYVARDVADPRVALHLRRPRVVSERADYQANRSPHAEGHCSQYHESASRE